MNNYNSLDGSCKRNRVKEGFTQQKNWDPEGLRGLPRKIRWGRSSERTVFAVKNTYKGDKSI